MLNKCCNTFAIFESMGATSTFLRWGAKNPIRVRGGVLKKPDIYKIDKML